MLDGLETVPIETVDKVLLGYFQHDAWFYLEMSEQKRRAELNKLCADGWIKSIDNKTFKTHTGATLAP